MRELRPLGSVRGRSEMSVPTAIPDSVDCSRDRKASFTIRSSSSFATVSGFEERTKLVSLSHVMQASYVAGGDGLEAVRIVVADVVDAGAYGNGHERSVTGF